MWDFGDRLQLVALARSASRRLFESSHGRHGRESPGVGKTTFANWLVEVKGFTRVDSDYPNLARTLDQLWAAARYGAMTPASFITEARRRGPVVVELGILAYAPRFRSASPPPFD